MLKAAFGLVLVVLAAGCGGDETPRWAGPPLPLAASGALPLDEFKTYLSDVDEQWETSAVGVAAAYALPMARDARSLMTTQRAEGQFAVATIGGLADDSVRDLRLAFSLKRDGETFTLTSGRWTQRCHQGRGHDDFSTARCI